MPKGNSDENIKEGALKTVAKSGSLVFVGMIISRFLGYLTRIVLARFLGPADMGLVYLAAAIAGILGTISVFGLPAAIQRYVSYYRGKEKLGKVKGVITSSLKISLPLSIVAGTFLFVFSDWIASAAFHKPVLSIALKIFAFFIPFKVVLTIFDSSIRGFEIIRYPVLVRKIIEPLAKLFPILLLIFLGFSVTAGAAGYTIGFIVAALVCFYFLEKKVFPFVETEVKSVSLKRKLIKFSWPLMLSGIIFTMMGKIDNLFIGSLIKKAEPLGVYNAAYPTSQFLMVIPIALSFFFLPIISNLLSKEKEEEIKDLYKTTSKWIFYVNFPIFLIFLIFPDAVLGVLFGKEFLSGGIVLLVLSIGFFVSSFGRLGKKIISLKERTKLHLINASSALAINIILDYTLIPIYGILGAGIATSTAFLVYGLLNLAEASYFMRVNPLNKNFLKSLGSALVSGSIIYWLTNIYLESLNLIIIIISTLLFLLIYSLILLTLKGLGQDDILILKAVEKKTGFESKKLRNLIRKFS